MGKIDWTQKRTLGRTDLAVSRLGVGSSFGVPASAVLEAFDRGVNYLYWGTYRRQPFAEAVRQLARRHRHEIVVTLQTYSPSAWVMKQALRHGLWRLGLAHADVLVLGLRNTPPSERIMDAAIALKEAGLTRYIAVSCHHRPTFQTYIRDERIDLIQVRYNAAHTGAERDVFPHLPQEGGPGVMAYTATRWGQLCDPQRVPPGEPVPRGSDCYRFALSNAHVDLCMCGPSDAAQMHEALETLVRGPMDPDELAWMRRVGQHIYANQGWLDGLPLMKRQIGTYPRAKPPQETTR